MSHDKNKHEHTIMVGVNYSLSHFNYPTTPAPQKNKPPNLHFLQIWGLLVYSIFTIFCFLKQFW